MCLLLTQFWSSERTITMEVTIEKDNTIIVLTNTPMGYIICAVTRNTNGKETEVEMEERLEDTLETISQEISLEEQEWKGCCCCKKTKERSEKEYKDLLNRLSRIEGQVRGIKKMVEKDAYCTEILTQVAAVNAALNSFNKVLLANHIKTCVTRDIKEGKEETVDELVILLQKLMK